MPRRPRHRIRKKVRQPSSKRKEHFAPRFLEPEMRGRWDKKKTPSQNYVAMGLKLNPNESDLQVENPVEFNVPEERPSAPKSMSRMEKLYFGSLIKKHKTNWKAMERDTNLNYNQHTAKQLKKRGLFYMEHYLNRQQNHKNRGNGHENEDDDDKDERE